MRLCDDDVKLAMTQIQIQLNYKYNFNYVYKYKYEYYVDDKCCVINSVQPGHDPNTGLPRD